MHCFSTGPAGKTLMTTSFLALETSPNKLIKITANTSKDKFAQAAESGDVAGLCGHLVSLVLLNKGPERTPLALLGNHVQTALLQLHANDTSSDVPGRALSPHLCLHCFESFPDVQIDVCCFPLFEGTPLTRDKPPSAVIFVLKCLTCLPFLMCQAVANQVLCVCAKLGTESNFTAANLSLSTEKVMPVCVSGVS